MERMFDAFHSPLTNELDRRVVGRSARDERVLQQGGST